MMNMIRDEINSHIKTAKLSLESLQSYIYTACVIATDTIAKGNKILIFGNGGSAADAQHIAAELVGRYKTKRKGLSAIALTTDTSALTAISNDFGYESVFERQVEALAREGDLLIGISTSGTSLNVIKALKLGRESGCRCIGLSGKDGGVMSEVCDINIVIPSSDTPRIQEMHIMIGHIICQAIDSVNG
ncbi:MAG: D-sedoheptulose 7-phosphate isomerase [Campylobacteraceae bacterium]|jgi:D-sedoheptulose 7-phosphate isomerase|nr:D-sedoheptulose 7-phosphate isomerase [Campylobacteraceae bacterium]